MRHVSKKHNLSSRKNLFDSIHSMALNPAESKVAAPYVRGLFYAALETGAVYQICSDFQSFEKVLERSRNLKTFLFNPTVNPEAKSDILTKILKSRRSKVNPLTLKFFIVLVRQNRINLINAMISSYSTVVYRSSDVKEVQVYTTFSFTKKQEKILSKKLTRVFKVNNVMLNVKYKPDLIGGFVITTPEIIIDLSIKAKLKRLATYLNIDIGLELEF